MESLAGGLILLTFFGAPMALGAYIAWKFGPQFRRNAAKRRMKAAMLQGMFDADVTHEAFEDLRREGRI